MRDADIGLVVMDEFHFYGDPDRGWAWQVPLLELPKAQFLLMSATLGDVTFLREDLTRRTGRPTALVANAERPVPLHYYYATTPMHETIGDLLDTKQAPIYVVHFTQASALERAQALMSVNVSTKEEKAAIADLIGGFRFSSAFGTTLSRLVRHGIGVHHAGMLPKYRRLVEQLAQAGLLKVICGTDTLGVGINVPIRTVVFSALSKYDGTRTRLLSAREFHQIAGRAGRAGYDTAGTVVVQAPDHEVENLKQFAKVADDPKKRRKLVRRKVPEGMVPWSESTMTRLVEAAPEPLTSNMRVSTAMILDVVDRPGDPFVAMRRLLTENHEPRKRQLQHIREAVGIARSLLQAGVLERLDEPEADGRRYRLTVDLPPDFALNQPLSTFALAAVDVLDPASETYALDVVSVIEATLEDPRQILAAQLNKARGEAVAQMKAEGIEYDERIELLDDVTYPKPLDELLGHAFEVYLQSNPWAADAQLSPKSVVREMWERAFTFREFVSVYGLTRSEGAVLRYLSDAFKALRSGVPAAARTEEVTDIVEWLGELVRQVDSSLLDEWEQLTSPDQPLDAPVGGTGSPAPADRQRAGVHRDGPQCAVPAGGAVRAAPLVRPRPAGRRFRVDVRALGGGHRRVLRRARRRGHRRRRPGPGAADHRPAARRVAGAADPGRPGRRPRLGLRRGGGPGGLRRGGRGRAFAWSTPAAWTSACRRQTVCVCARFCRISRACKR